MRFISLFLLLLFSFHSIGVIQDDHLSEIRSLIKLVQKLVEEDRGSEAITFGLKAIELSEKYYGPQDTKTVYCLNNLASAYANINDYKNAILMGERSRIILDKIKCEDYSLVAGTIYNLAFYYHGAFSFEKAKQLYERALNVSENKNVQNISLRVHILDSYSVLLKDIKEYDKAVVLSEQAYSIKQKIYGSMDDTTLSTMNNLAFIYVNQKKEDKAIGLFAKVQKYAETNKETGTIKYAAFLNFKAQVFIEMRKYDYALENINKSIDIEGLIGLGLNPQILKSFDIQKDILIEIGDYKQALSVCEKALDISQKIYGISHLSTIIKMNNMGVVYHYLGDYKNAERTIKEALNISIKIFGYENYHTAVTEGNLASIYQEIAKYDEAIDLYYKSKKTIENIYGQNSSQNVINLKNIAEFYFANKKYSEALDLYNQARKIIEEIDGPTSQNIASCYNEIGKVYLAMGENAKAFKYLAQAKSIYDNTIDPESIKIVSSLSNLASFYFATGELGKAIPLCTRLLTILENKLGREHPQLINPLTDIVNIFMEMGLLDKAYEYCLRALKISIMTFGQYHPKTGLCLSKTASILAAMGDYQKAYCLFKRAIDISEKIFGKDSLNTASIISDLANLYMSTNKYYESLSKFKEVLEIRERKLGKQHHLTIQSLTNLGLVSIILKDYANAELYSKRSNNIFLLIEIYIATNKSEKAIKLLEKNLPGEINTPKYIIQYYTQLGAAYYQIKRFSDAATAYIQAVKRIERIHSHTLGNTAGFYEFGIFGGYIRSYKGLVASLAECGIRNEKISKEFDVYGSNSKDIAFYFAEKIKARSLFEYILNREVKENILEVPIDILQEGKKLDNQFAALQKQWENIFIANGNNYKEIETRQEQLQKQYIEYYEKIRIKYPHYFQYKFPHPMMPQEISIKDNEVIIEYVVTENMTYAFYIKKGHIAELSRIEINKDNLEYKVKDFVAPFLSKKGQGYSNSLSKELSKLLLNIEDINKSSRIIIVPDGILASLPFDALIIEKEKPNGEPQYISDLYHVSYNESATIMANLRWQNKQLTNKKLFALGDPIFDNKEDIHDSSANKNINIENNFKKKKDIEIKGLLPGLFNCDTHDLKSESVSFLPLTRTKDEVLSISGMFNVMPVPPDILLGENANESIFKKTALGDYQYIHFATHARLPSSMEKVNEPLIILGQLGNEPNDDGVLTISEVIRYNLNAELVVLSCCSTGRGDIIEGEGVMNFARAFHMAGAKGVIVSLWEVYSEAAVDFMKKLYGNILIGMSNEESIWHARQEIKKIYPDPYYWGVFVLYGE